jgi:prepilin-type N-terminal cleavage/methylation domain-containing protein
MKRQTTPAGFSLPELLAVLAVAVLLAAILWPTLAEARGAARRATCTSHLRQIGRAYELYLADYGRYPRPAALAGGASLTDRRVFFCPEDVSVRVRGGGSSYSYRDRAPLDAAPLSTLPELAPATVLVDCSHHLGRPAEPLQREEPGSPPPYPFHLVLRAGGSVDRVHFGRVRTVPLPGNGRVFTRAYPGEPRLHGEGGG